MEKLNYTAKEACEVAQVSAPTLRKWTRTPGFPVLRAGKKILIPVDAFKRWLEAQASHDAC
ncbi:MAG: helix-turn-helix domain-containing protein [Eubacteriales bacterium]|nr:helix-turn-helix domain-containing protein [Eubacteriales bacterium]